MWLASEVKAGRLNIRVSLWVPVTIVGLSGILAWREMLGYYPLADYLMLPGFALLIVVAGNRDRLQLQGRLDRLLLHRKSIYLGEVSFAFYLVHTIVLSVVEHVAHWGHRWGTLEGAAPATILFALSLAAAMALHHTVEKPVRRQLMKIGRRSVAAPLASYP